MKRLRNSKGFTFIELLVTMAVMVILGTIVIGLLQTGLHSSDRISSDTKYETQARTALSLITVQIRQHDQTGAITVSGDSLQLRDNPTAANPLNKAGTVILFTGGSVYAIKTDDVTAAVSPAGLTPVATVGSVAVTAEVQNDANIYTVTIQYGPNGNDKTLSQTVTQRSNL